jgi:hypothetical protein
MCKLQEYYLLEQVHQILSVKAIPLELGPDELDPGPQMGLLNLPLLVLQIK